MSRLVLFVLLVSVVGCSHEVRVQKPVAKHKKKVRIPPLRAEMEPASPNISVSNELADRCMVQLADAARTPKFDYDEAALLEEDRNVLDLIGKCVMQDGPLAGRALQLVGRADPRGTQEYNLALGDRRANAVSAYLVRMGVERGQISVSTRGDLDADGTNESGWRNDRRVDLQLMEDAKVSDAR